MHRDMARREWNGSDLARAAKLSPMTVSRVLNDQRHNPETVGKLARALGHTIDRYLLGIVKRIA